MLSAKGGRDFKIKEEKNSCYLKNDTWSCEMDWFAWLHCIFTYLIFGSIDSLIYWYVNKMISIRWEILMNFLYKKHGQCDFMYFPFPYRFLYLRNVWNYDFRRRKKNH